MAGSVRFGRLTSKSSVEYCTSHDLLYDVEYETFMLEALRISLRMENRELYVDTSAFSMSFYSFSKAITFKREALSFHRIITCGAKAITGDGEVEPQKKIRSNLKRVYYKNEEIETQVKYSTHNGSRVIARRLSIMDRSKAIAKLKSLGKEKALMHHIKRLAIAFGLINMIPETTLRSCTRNRRKMQNQVSQLTKLLP
ncbi:hypothetical protein HID58_066844 [Brassica napus]|uniref:Uncharacterized protein n=1 Tax=Brassica napus TaxID=3708 RepID=A0ABQ7ZGS4_BRANA|nr:hypothetical protein HID58_066844 [Brassica napus]